MFEKFKRLKFISSFLRWLNSNLSYCQKCGLPWNCCEEKSVKTSDTSGTFATCKYCWEHSTLEQLKGYYTQTYKMQEEIRSESGGTLNHTLEHLLTCVERDYNEDIRKNRYNKILKMKNKIKREC